MPKLSAGSERRQHPRFPVRAYASMYHTDQQWRTHLLDMSVNGARLALMDEHNLKPGDALNLTVDIGDLALRDIGQKAIHLRGSLVQLRDELLGIEYQPASETDRQLLTLFLSQTE